MNATFDDSMFMSAQEQHDFDALCALYDTYHGAIPVPTPVLLGDGPPGFEMEQMIKLLQE